MGSIEQKARKQRQKRNIQNAVLTAVGVAGVLAVAMIAPNIFKALPRVAGDKYRMGYRAKTTVGRLAQKGLVRFVQRSGIRYVEITDKGRRVLFLTEAKNIHQQKWRRWDKRFRLVMFDVPQYRRDTRDKLRAYMREYGFLRVQDSVWVYPYDCEELIALLKAELRVGKDVLYAIVESMENDGWIKRHFGLRA
ncbi:CRISPR-associated endonuclease Cas2 [Candidatus Kaiserbacteria bacterium RIFCSPHIGHO2_01_FULL_55_17]|uniref:CRISPR-associated endoribonuclease Cas2 n=1 Tax=Candidatus Kaiserbacteria bacterium RIFCSPHIGHO2_01_FULL_55_17 TaxID=1798484 RepID=A0A1F6D983_9BACT|nr:MAG: CRISPR-associated endonuclease Cas2 [Candidatus Kaiserbacteria bacterium RIFCSPHIGHO2_01_FULL_55_17]